MSTDQHHARVAFVGAGPGDPGLLTMRAARLIENADAVIFDQICGERFIAPFVRDEVELVDAGYGDAGAQLTTASRAKLVVKTAKSVAAQHDDADSSARGGEQPLVVRLMDGDPSAFSGLAAEALACRSEGVSFEIVPGVSTAWSVPAYAGVPLTAHESTGALHMVTAGDPHVDWSLSAGDDVTVVILGCGKDLLEALRGLSAAGRSEDSPVALTEHGLWVLTEPDGGRAELEARGLPYGALD